MADARRVTPPRRRTASGPRITASALAPVRIFTPASELPFAGHPVVGTHWVLAHLGRVELQEPVTRVHLELGVGVLPANLHVANGQVERVVAAHDGGRIINPTLFESQIEGAVVMGLGYALSEELPMENGQLKTKRYGKLGIPRIKNIPKIVVKMVEVEDPLGPYGAKGVGEIGNIPTAGAVANALFRYDGEPRYKLPMKQR